MKGELNYFDNFGEAFPYAESPLCESCCGPMDDDDDGLAVEGCGVEDPDTDTEDREFEIYYHFSCWMKTGAEKELSKALGNQGHKTVMSRPLQRPPLARRRVPNRVRGQRGRTMQRGPTTQRLQKTWPR